jgi:hypothetical protein
MTRILLRSVAAGLSLLASVAAAQARYDGAWAIDIVTDRGRCDRLYRYYVVVNGETVRLRSPFGDTVHSAAGLVRPNGRIDVTVGQTDDPVSVKGRLGEARGAGVWAAPARRCTGRWSARKRDTATGSVR